MRKLGVRIGILICIGFEMIGLQAQDAIPASGGNATGIGGSASYTLGQLVFTTTNGINGSVSAGVQQALEFSMETHIKEPTEISHLVSVYPNPASEFLIVKLDALFLLTTKPIRYELYDTYGRLLESKTIESDETQIDMRNYTAAVYYLKIHLNKERVETIQIIKTKLK